MAGLPLKSGADFYNLEAARLRLHNLGADPTEVGAGLIYFNTSSGLNTSQKARLYTGSAWKTIAFSEDLDVASNADFLALQRRVDLIQGSVDTTDIIDNLTDVKNFLDGIKESDGDLMTMLNKKANSILNLQADLPNIDANLSGLIGGKLQSAEGTFPSGRYSSGAFLAFGYAGYEVQLSSRDNVTYIRTKEAGTASAWHTLLTSAGGTIEGSLAVSSGTISSLRTSTRRAVFYKNASESVDSGTYIVDVSDSGDAVLKLTYNDLTWKGNTLLHSGNVGEYAMNVNKKLDIQTSVNETGYAYSSNGWTTSGAAITIGSSSEYRMAFQGDYGPSLGTRLQYNYCYGGEWKGWKTIAFTDSNVAGATYLVDANGKGIVKVNSGGISILDQASTPTFRSVVEYKANNLHLGYDNMTSAVGYDTYLNGKNVYLRYSGGNTGLILNSSGNVTIGGSDLASTTNKLYVEGRVKVTNRVILGEDDNYGIWRGSNFSGSLSVNDIAVYGTKIILDGGNVGIGTTDPKAKLDINGGIRSNAFINLYEGNTTNKIDAFVSGGIGRIYAYSDSTNDYLDLYLGRNGAGAIVVKGNGNVLIGTTTDTGERLQVKGDIGGVEHLSFVGGWISMGVVRNSSNAVQDLIIQAGSNKPLSINPSGNNNVLIGTTEDNGAKLQVDGSVSISTKNGLNSYLKLFRRVNGDGGLLFHEANTMTWQVVDTSSDGALSFYDYKSNKYIAKLHSDGATINGDLHVTGNIIADGEVSAGGAAEEGGNAGGGGAFHSDIIKEGATQTTIAHGLGTDDIVVSIYEKDGVSGRWSIILTDVEIVDANNIIVSFGSATTVEHKVVIMGAVA